MTMNPVPAFAAQGRHAGHILTGHTLSYSSHLLLYINISLNIDLKIEKKETADKEG